MRCFSVRRVFRTHDPDLPLIGIPFHVDQAAGENMRIVRQHETAGARERFGLVDSEHRAGAQDDIPDAVTADLVPAVGRQILDIENALDGFDRNGNIAGRDLQVIIRALLQRLLRQPEQAAAEHSGFQRRMIGVTGEFAAFDEELVFEREADGLPGFRLCWRRSGMPGLDGSTRAILLDGENNSRSPTLSRPDSMRPARMRRSSNL